MKAVALVAAGVVAVAWLSGCASVKSAQPKVVDVEGQKLEFGGSYSPRDKELTLTVNGDPVMRGKFPPFTPTQRLTGTYRNLAVTGDCYFGSVLSSTGGVGGIVAGAVQGARGKGGDKCDILVNGKVVEALFF